MRFEALPGSTLPDQLREAGYDVTEIGTTQRILSHAVEDKFVIGTGGELELADWRSLAIKLTVAAVASGSRFGAPMHCHELHPCHRAAPLHSPTEVLGRATRSAALWIGDFCHLH